MILITVTQTEGSTPREVGAWMMVDSHEHPQGTLGGGHVEYQAIAYARHLLAQPSARVHTQRYVLGPSLGQCCGGVMTLSFQHIQPQHLADLQARQRQTYRPVALFGGGHVGRALVNLLQALSFRITWIDSRDEVFPTQLAPQVHCEHSDPVQDAVSTLEAGSQVLIMSFSHAEDLAIVQQCLRRQRDKNDLPFIGLIGSKTKWASFQSRLRERGFTPAELAQVTCPIGLAGISGKEPPVIAVAVAAQLLQRQTHPSTNSGRTGFAHSP